MPRLRELCDEQRSQSAEFVEDDGWQRLVAERHQVRLSLNSNPNIPILIPNPILDHILDPNPNPPLPRYMQPSGDYDANCYLKIDQVTPDDVRVNDNNCNFFSEDYLCQPRKPGARG